MCLPFFFVFTLCCWLCHRNVCFKLNNTVPQTHKYTVTYITCTRTQSVCQTWCRGLAFSCKNTPANWTMHQTTFTRALNSRRADAEHKAAIVIKSSLTCSCHSRWPPFLKRAGKPVALSASQPKQTTKGQLEEEKKNKLTKLAAPRHRYKHCSSLSLAGEC